MRVLVTGGAGFIGSAVVRHMILELGWTVRNVDCLAYSGNERSLDPVSHSSDYSFCRFNICETEQLRSVIFDFRPDVIMHLAAESHVDRSIDSPDIFLQTNIIGTYSLLTVARDYYKQLSIDEQRRFRFHHVSTDEVYGELLESEDPFTETNRYRPNSPYAASKAASDHLVSAWNRTYGLPTIITNCSNNYGPYHFPEKLIPHTILSAIGGKDLPIYGNGHQVRDWLFVDDHARALATVASIGKVGETYNIGGLAERRNIDVVRQICAILDDLRPRTDGASYCTQIAHVRDRPGHDYRYAMDINKIKSLLGWEPRENFETGLRKTVEWYLDNEVWWREILDGTYKLQRIGAME